LDANKSAKMNALLKTAHQRWGSAAPQPLSHFLSEKEEYQISTGFSGLDEVISGIPGGSVVEILGRLTSGATSLVHKITGAAQGEANYAVYVDLDGTFDPVYAAQNGIKLDRLYLVHPQTNIQALDIARDLLRSTGRGIMVVDLGAALPDARLLHRLTGAVATAGCIVVVLLLISDSTHPYRLFAGSPATLRLQLERKAVLRDYGDIVGYQSTVNILKSRIPVKHSVVDIEIRIEGMTNGDSM
jgi:KaiC/GvpD/RAD55 family RecA-like ATPase